MWSNFRVKKLVIKHEFKIGHYDRRAGFFRPIFQLIRNVSITVSSDYEVTADTSNHATERNPTNLQVNV